MAKKERPVVELQRDAAGIIIQEGAAIRGEKIICKARKVIRLQVQKGSSRHKIQTYACEENAFAVINKAFRDLRGQTK